MLALVIESSKKDAIKQTKCLVDAVNDPCAALRYSRKKTSLFSFATFVFFNLKMGLENLPWRILNVKSRLLGFPLDSSPFIFQGQAPNEDWCSWTRDPNWQQWPCDLACKYAGAKSTRGEQKANDQRGSSWVSWRVHRARPTAASANKIQILSPSSVSTANRPLFRLLAHPRCFSNPAEHHSAAIAGWVWLMKGAAARWWGSGWPLALTGVIRCDSGLDGCSGCFSSANGGPHWHKYLVPDKRSSGWCLIG